MEAGRELGPDDDAYIKGLDEAGLLPNGGFGLIDLIHMPDKSAAKLACVALLPEITVEFV